MFTGLVEGMARLVQVETRDVDRRFRLEYPFCPPDVVLGASIAINGCCLTVIQAQESQFDVEAGSETLSRTTLGTVVEGDLVNVERSIRALDRLGGHFVTGHVDCVAEVVSRKDEAEWSTMEFRPPSLWMSQIASKGSVAVDGVSLTVVDVRSDRFSVALIPHTLARTTLGTRHVGQHVNLETDILAKYVQRALGLIS
jgi:riboflavin synthase